MPLAFSARCFTARHHNLPKDDCQFGCLDYPDGLLLSTKEAQPFLVLNGIQTQSSRVYNLVHALPEMTTLGVDVVRISPQEKHTESVIRLFSEVLNKQSTPEAAQAALQAVLPGEPCNGFWHGRTGQDWVE